LRPIGLKDIGSIVGLTKEQGLYASDIQSAEGQPPGPSAKDQTLDPQAKIATSARFLA
jgi:hypothetical protein